MANDQTGGSSGLRGYEYQILVTVWLALKLLIEGGLCRELEIEPATEEDIAAKLKVDEEKSTGLVGIKLKEVDLDIQVKSRRGALWTNSAFKEVLEGKPVSTTKPAEKGKPKTKSSAKKKEEVAPSSARTRPLERLKQAPDRRYLFITDAQLHSQLAKLCVKGIGDLSLADSLPVTIDAGDTKVLAQRLGVLEQMTEERLLLEIRDILSRHAHVQPLALEETIADFKHAVRRRLLKEIPGAWRVDDLHGVIQRHGGMPPTPRKVVFPLNINDIRTQLEKGAVILSGLTGTGKTILAECLEYEHRVDPNPFEVVTKEASPGDIRKCLRGPGRHLFVLEDPWGHYELEAEASRWRSELPKLLPDASPENRFLITTRSAIEELAFRGTIPVAIRNAEIVLRDEHYSTGLRKEILQTLMKGGKPWQIDFANHRADEIVKALRNPYSIDLFTQQLKKQGNAADIKFDDLIKSSEVESVSGTTADEIEELGPSSIAAAIALWTQFTTRKIVTQEAAQELGKSIKQGGYHSLLDAHGLLTWLDRMGQLIRSPSGYSMHPKVMEGLEILLKRHPVTADEVISSRLKALAASDNGMELEILAKQIAGRRLEVPPVAQSALNNHLLTRFLQSDEAGWREAFTSLSKFSTDTRPIALLVKGMKVVEDDSFPGFAHFAPATLDPVAIAAIKNKTESKEVAERFINVMLDDNIILAGEAEELVSFFERFGWDFSETFHKLAIQALSNGSRGPVGLFVSAALLRSNRFAEELTSAALDAYKAAEDWYEGFAEEQRRAEQDELDADYTTHITEEPGEYFAVPAAALEAVMQVRRSRESFDWIMKHPRRNELLWAWAETIDSSVNDAELNALESVCNGELTKFYWKALSKAAKVPLAPKIASEIKTAPLSLLDSALTELSILIPVEDWQKFWEKHGKDLPEKRRLELLNCHISHDRRSQRHISLRASLFSPGQAEALGACYQESEAAVTLDHAQKEFLKKIIPDAPDPLALAALSTLEFPEPLTVKYLPRLLKSESSRVREGAIQALSKPLTGLDTRAALRLALKDNDYVCRTCALKMLADAPEANDIDLILKSHKDLSGSVRQACAEVIGRKQWAQGIPVLLELIYDNQNSADGVGLFKGNNAKFDVARTAASAFSAFPELPADVIAKIIECIEKYRPIPAQEHRMDSGVPYQLLISIANQRNRAIANLYLRKLWDDWYVEGFRHSGYPLRTACAIGLVCQLVDSTDLVRELDPGKILEGAEHDDDRFAGFCLLAAALMLPRTDESLRLIINSPELSEDRALLLGAVIPENSELWKTLDAKFPPTSPFRKLLTWAEAHREDGAQAADEFLATNHDVQDWLIKIRPSQGVYPQLRLWLKHRFGKSLGHVINPKDAFEGHLPEGIPLLKIIQPRRS